MAKTLLRVLTKTLRWAGRIIASAAIILFGAWGTYFSFFGNTSEVTFPLAIYIALLLVALACLILSWWRDIFGSIILILFSTFLMWLVNYISYNFNLWLLLGLPLLVAGIFLLIAWLLSRSSQTK